MKPVQPVTDSSPVDVLCNEPGDTASSGYLVSQFDMFDLECEPVLNSSLTFLLISPPKGSTMRDARNTIF